MNCKARFALLSLLLATPTALRGQDTVQVSPGQRIRIWALDFRLSEAEGIAGRLHADTLFFESDTATYVVPHAAITRIEVSAGRTKRGFLGGVLGFVVGGALGAAYGAADHPGLPHLCSGECAPATEYVLPFGALGAIGGALIGAGSSERWTPARLPLANPQPDESW